MPTAVRLKLVLVPVPFVWLAGWVMMEGALCAWRFTVRKTKAQVTNASGFVAGICVFI